MLRPFSEQDLMRRKQALSFYSNADHAGAIAELLG
jgi:hypothetical protein